MSNLQGRDQPACTRCGLHGCTWCAWSLQMEARDPAAGDPGGRLKQRSPRPLQRSPRAVKRVDRAEYIASVVAVAPPLSPGQTQRLQTILLAAAPETSKAPAGNEPRRPRARLLEPGNDPSKPNVAPPADIRSSERGDS